MTCRIEQTSEYVGKDYWRWAAWLEGGDSELDEVAEVVWILHPTFKQSRVKRTDRVRKFRLDTAGWGTFLLKAQVGLKKGEQQLLKHYLRFETPEGQGSSREMNTRPSSEGRKPKVFFSYSAEDSRKAATLRESFEDAGIEVLDQTRLAAGEPWKESLQKMISRSDAVIGLISEDEISPWVRAEIAAAGRAEKPVFALLPPQSSSSGIPDNAQQLNAEQFDPSEIAALLRSKGDT